MDMRWLLRNKALAATAVLDFAVTAFSVSILLMMLGLAWPAACVAGIVAAHSTPVVLASFMPDWQPDGQISARGLHLSGINTLLAALCLPLALVLGQAWQQGAAQSTGAASWPALPLLQRSGWDLAQPLMLLMLSLAVGAALGRLLARPKDPLQNAVAITRLQSAGDSMGLVAAACVCAGLAQWWGAPAWAACLALGLALRSPTGAAWRAGQAVQQVITPLAQLVLFGLSALTLFALMGQSSAQFAHLEVAVGMMIPLVALILLVRLLAKLLVCTLTARWAALRWQQGFALGLAMQPLSFTGLALLLLAWPMLMQDDALLASSLVVALVISDCLAPLGMRALLQRCGEIAPDEIVGMHSRNSTQPVRVDTSRDSVAPSVAPSLTPNMAQTAG
jgi:Kef-type K+ transport system membrane component KefB